MEKIKICVSIAEKTAEDCIRSLQGLEFAEIRMDKMQLLKDDLKKIFSQKTRLTATCRPAADRSDAERKELLLAAIDAGAAYVDVEVEASDEYKKEIIEKAKAAGCKAIISYHNHEKTPSRQELEKIIDWCFESGADIAKIACKVNKDGDNAKLVGLLDSERKLVVVGMGERGRITRVIAPLLGSAFTYASLSKGKETAEGQISIVKMQQIMELFR